MPLSITEENYLKAILSINNASEGRVSNQLIAERLNVNPASVTDMLRKLDEKRLIDYNRADGAKLTKDGFKQAVKTVRKHRLWETFLFHKMNFTWDEVHEVAEQLEHIHSDKLLDELDKMLGYPKFDPHGDPIPDASGRMPVIKSKPLPEADIACKLKVVSVTDNSPAFLKYLDKQGIGLNDNLTIKEVLEFDKSLLVEIRGKKEVFLSHEAAGKILVD